MSISTAKQFVAVLDKSRLMKPKHLDAVRLAAEKEPDPKALAGRLVKKGLLSRWQAKQLLAGHASFYLGEYRLIEPLSTHAGSHVYLAEHKTLGRRVVLKRLPRAVMDHPERKKRLLSGVRAAVGLDHENLARVYSVEQAGDRYYVISQYIEGRDLATTVAEAGPLAFQDAASTISQAAAGLAEAHRRKAAHGGVRPSNLVMGADGQVRLVSVATARRYEPDDQPDGDKAPPETLDAVHYQAPELSKPEAPATPASDIYSLGCTLYFLLTGNPPFAEGTASERATAHARHQPAGILRARPDAPDALVKACRKMLAKQPEDRPGSAAEVVEMLAELRPSEPSTSQPAAAGLAKASQGKPSATAKPQGARDTESPSAETDPTAVDDAALEAPVSDGPSPSDDAPPARIKAAGKAADQAKTAGKSGAAKDDEAKDDEGKTEDATTDKPSPAKPAERRPPLKAAKPAPRRRPASDDEDDEYKLASEEPTKPAAPAKKPGPGLAIETGGADSPAAKTKSRAGKSKNQPPDREADSSDEAASKDDAASPDAGQESFMRKNAKWLLIGGGSLAVLLLATAVTLPFVLGGSSPESPAGPQVAQSDTPAPPPTRSTKPGPAPTEPAEGETLAGGIDLNMDLGIDETPRARASSAPPADEAKPTEAEADATDKPAAEAAATSTPAEKAPDSGAEAGAADKPKTEGAEQKPAETKPAEEKPAENKPTEDKPAEEKKPEPPKKEKPPTFRDLPAVVVLPAPPAAGQAAEPFNVGKLHVRERAPWIAQLDGGDGVIPNAELALARDEGRAYVVRLTPRDQAASAIGRFWFDEKAATLRFQWLEAAATTPGAAQLRLCQLRLTIDGESKSVAFSKPLHVPPIEFDLDKKNDRIVIDVDDLPDDKLLRFEITTIEGIDLKTHPFETQPAGPVEAKKPVTLTLKRMDRNRNGQPIGILQVNFLPSRKGLTVSRRIDQPPRRMLPAAQVPMARQQVEEEFKKTTDQMNKAEGHGAKDKFRPQLDQMEMGLGHFDLLELIDKQVKIHYRIMLQAGNHRVPLYDSQAEAPPAAQ